jgi:hypothetical protein
MGSLMNLGIHRRIQIEVTNDLLVRFWAKVDRRSETECWPWKASTREGYGCIRQRNKVYSAHCVSWIIANGTQIPEGEIVRHTCDNRSCCNPAHLTTGSPLDNVRDMHERHPELVSRTSGEMSHKAILTEPLVRAIRLLNRHGYGRVRLARMLGLDGHEGTINSVLKGESWRHLL